MITDRERRRRKRVGLIIAMGGRCVCCGSAHRLQFDHKIARSRGGVQQQLSLIEANQGEFQLLCRNCNYWKSTGPICPCRWWDEVEPGWRAAKAPELRRVSHGEASSKAWAAVPPQERKARMKRASDGLTPEILIARNRKIVATRRITDRARASARENMRRMREKLTPEILLARNRKVAESRRRNAKARSDAA